MRFVFTRIILFIISCLVVRKTANLGYQAFSACDGCASLGSSIVEIDVAWRSCGKYAGLFGRMAGAPIAKRAMRSIEHEPCAIFRIYSYFLGTGTTRSL